MPDSTGSNLANAGQWFAAHARPILVVIALIWAILTVGLYRGASWATWVWPWADTDMTYIFLASIAAAVAVPLAWLALVNEPAAAAGLALDAAGIGSVCAVALVIMGASSTAGNLLIYGAGLGASALLGWLVFRLTGTLSLRDASPLPRAVRILFIVIVAALVVLGGALMLRLDNVYAWDLPPRTSTLIGAWFLGAGVSFVFGIWRNSWVHAGSTLCGFLAYDAVQFVPYLRTMLDHDGTAEMRLYPTYSESDKPISTDVNEFSLGVYLSAITLGAAVAIYFLFIYRPTRIWRHLTH